MIVDCHTHFLPTPLLEALRAAKAGTPMGPFLAHPLDRLDQQLPILDAEEIERALLTYSMLLEPAIAAAGMSRAEGVRLANDEMAAAIRQFPDRFLGAAAVDSAAGEAALPELERAVRELGMRAVHMVTNYDGLFLDSPTFWPIYRRAEELGVPVMVHPTAPKGWTALQAAMEADWIAAELGSPLDTTLSIARMIMRGVFDEFRQLRICFCHLGGFMPMLAGRLDTNYEMYRTVLGPAGADALGVTRRASDYFGRYYVDIHSMDTPAIECALKTVGPERVVFGSDFPYNPPTVGIRFAKQRLAALDAPQAVKERIARENARELLGL
ncbi:MAG TPA: amidohydrolase family protein [Chloroflexota bacterium]|nr:amidohydrolase family protein [Chloroflexota bacterium]